VSVSVTVRVVARLPAYSRRAAPASRILLTYRSAVACPGGGDRDPDTQPGEARRLPGKPPKPTTPYTDQPPTDQM